MRIPWSPIAKMRVNRRTNRLISRKLLIAPADRHEGLFVRGSFPLTFYGIPDANCDLMSDKLPRRLGLTPVFQDHNLGVAFEPYVSRSFNGCEIGSR